MSWTPEKAAVARAWAEADGADEQLSCVISDALAEIDRLTKALDTEWGAGWDQAVEAMKAKQESDWDEPTKELAVNR